MLTLIIKEKTITEKNDALLSKFLNISSKTSEQTKLLVTSSRKLDRFKGRPEKGSDPTLEE